MTVALEQFVKQLTDSGVIAPGKLENFVPPKAAPKDAQELARQLVQSKHLTIFQAQEIYRGRAKSLILGNYTLLDKIGAGGMGQVFKAEHRRMKRIVAIKMLPKAVTKNAEAVARFQREVEAAAKLRHHNIVAADDADEAGGVHFLVMEYVEGSDLAVLVKKQGPLPVATAVDYVLQAARGLDFAHGEGVVHRDIKPSNLLLDKRGTVKVLDMGLARINSDGNAATQAELTGTGAVLGTIDYIAPEQALSTRNADARADIYSLGCTLYYLLTGKPTYGGDSLMAKLLAHREEPIPALGSDVPDGLQEIFEKMAAKQVEDRYQTMSDVIAALEPFGSGHPTSGGAQQSIGTNADLAALTFLRDAPVRSAPVHKAHHPKTVKTPTPPKSDKNNKKLIPVAIGAALLGLALLAGIVFKIATREGLLTVEIDENLGKDVQVAVSQGGENVKVADAKSGWTLSLGAGKYDLAVQGGDEQFQLDAQNITVTHGGQVKVTVTLKPATPAVAPFDAQQAKRFQDGWARQLGVPVEVTNSIGMKLMLIPPGEFLMGSPREVIDEQRLHGRDIRDELQHRVRITKAFWMGTTHVTQEEYARIMGSNPSNFKGDPNLAVERPSWKDAVEFCRKLSELPEEKAAKRCYLLPTEAQWEYACRAGSAGRWCFSDSSNPLPLTDEEKLLSEYAWFKTNSGGRAHPVGQKRANAWGLHDMHGTLLQWCSDWYNNYPMSTTDDPTGPPGWFRGQDRVSRGGSWNDDAVRCTSARRCGGQPQYGYDDHGFRVSMVLGDAADGSKTLPSTQYSVLSPQVSAPIPPPAVAPFDAAKAKQHQEAWANHLGVPVEITNSIGMKLLLIPPGEFMMGSPKEVLDEELRLHRSDFKDELQHRVRVTKAFWMGATHVTQEDYQRIMRSNPSNFKGDLKRPVERVSWVDAANFCRRLSDLPEEKATKRRYTLPSEAQWEYACRAGSAGRWCFSDPSNPLPLADEEKLLSEYAWFKQNAGGQTHPIGQKRANAWGLHDMHGTLMEWCSDWYNDYPMSAIDDPTGAPGWNGGSYRVSRGGSFTDDATRCRSARRCGGNPEHGYGDHGFRISMVLADAADGPTTVPSNQYSVLSPQVSAPIPPPAVAPFDAAKAKQHQEAWARHLGMPVEITNSIGMKLALIPPGEFMMGSSKEQIEDELKRPDNDQSYKENLLAEGPQHRMRITRPFYLGTYLVTQQEYERVMGNNPSAFSATGGYKDKVTEMDTKRFPVEWVSWVNASLFCQKLSEMPEERSAGRVYRLPTAAQWEYACRAGNPGRYSFSLQGKAAAKQDEDKMLSDYGWSQGNSDGMSHPVGLKRPGAWGLYDMHGNVWEWCQDWYDKNYYANSPTDDPPGTSSGSDRVKRGGSWYGSAKYCRSAKFGHNIIIHDDSGFRVCQFLVNKPDGSKAAPSAP